MKKLGLLGGSFDPVHKAHIAIAKEAQKSLGVEEVHFILAKEAPHKQAQLDAETRWKLLTLALSGERGLVASRIELDRDGISYSYLTVDDYKKLYPDTEFFWILGEDAFAHLEEWKNYDYLASNLEFYVVPRELDISSTMIRDRINNGESLKSLVPESIQQLVAGYYSKSSVV